MIRVNNIKLEIDHKQEDINKKVCKILKVSSKDIKSLYVVKKSIDARDKSKIKFVYSVDVAIKNEDKFLNLKDVSKVEKYEYITKVVSKNLNKRPVIVGAGPAGLFAALILAEAGCEPIIIEQGKDVEARKKDVDIFWKTGKLNINSNVQFGEGGAGAFSDGKLTTGIKDIRIGKVLREFVECGAPEEILIEQKPHIGTDNLMNVLKEMRKKIISLGGEFRFMHKLSGFKEKNNKLQYLIVEDISKEDEHKREYEIETDYAIIAVGHSARDTFEMLYENKLKIEAKSFAVGVRIEHKQSFINKSQYGEFASSKHLGSAEYKLSTHLGNGRTVYTFCMCPGGVVVAAASEKNSVVVNGMSYYKRDLENANSALLVSINPNDFGSDHPLAGTLFQKKLERDAFVLGGSDYNAPAQLVGDFLRDTKTEKFGNVIPSYTRGVKASNLRECFPDFIVESLKQGIISMDKKIKGFSSYDAVLTGVESRSSSPIKIFRNNSLHSNIKGIIPCGEGAGYAGGITSAAVDGIKCAEEVINDQKKFG